MNYRAAFDKSLGHVSRDGVQEFVQFLERETDFFTAPASTRFHGNYEGGLLEHSINVLSFAYTNFNFMVKRKPELEYLRESVILCSLFHDVCKTNIYHEGEKLTKNNADQWVRYKAYELKDEFPLGHGEKSVFMIQKYIELTNAEAMAIRWHPGPWEAGISIHGVTRWTFEKAVEHPLVRIIHTADVLSIELDGFIDYKSQAENS